MCIQASLEQLDISRGLTTFWISKSVRLSIILLLFCYHCERPSVISQGQQKKNNLNSVKYYEMYQKKPIKHFLGGNNVSIKYHWSFKYLEKRLKVTIIEIGLAFYSTGLYAYFLKKFFLQMHKLSICKDGKML